jgi:DNA invertase Pin-like site-specific DNA recombinase
MKPDRLADDKAAAQYLRMSTTNQRYSIANQARAIAAYAEEHGYRIVRTYKDAGKSGLTLKGRDGLKALIQDVVSGKAPYSSILVLDVSRWGRFQDPDQAAHYEFLCREAGVRVRYCAEPFDDSNAPMTSIIKHMKRVMAGEYSRELSEKVGAGRRRIARMGFVAGGTACYGFRRLLIDQDGKPRFMLDTGQRKALSSDRVIFVHGPPEEIAVIRRIFRMYITDRLRMTAISRRLNDGGIPSSLGHAWTAARVKTVLTSELCIGNYVFNRTAMRLKGKRKTLPERDWIRVKMMDPIISRHQFNATAKLLKLGQVGKVLRSNAELLDLLRRLLKEKGRLSAGILSACPYTPSAGGYRERFGSLSRAYGLIGYQKEWGMSFRTKEGRVASNEDLLDAMKRLWSRRGYLSTAVIRDDPDLPGISCIQKRFGSLRDVYALIGHPVSHSEIITATHARNRAIRAAAAR